MVIQKFPNMLGITGSHIIKEYVPDIFTPLKEVGRYIFAYKDLIKF